MSRYSEIPDVEKILLEVEDTLTEIIGRYEAQRFISLFANLQGTSFALKEPRNVWEELFNKGKEATKKP